MDTELLRCFLVVVAHSSIRRSAVAFGVPQSVLSRRIARLERHLNVRLLDRATDGVRPTALAESVIPEMIAIVEACARIVARSGQPNL